MRVPSCTTAPAAGPVGSLMFVDMDQHASLIDICQYRSLSNLLRGVRGGVCGTLASWFDKGQYRGVSNLTPRSVADVSTPLQCCPPLGQEPLSAADAEKIAALFKALSDPVRLRLLMHLAERRSAEVAVHELADVGVSQATVSHHLKRLRCAGLIESRREGRLVYCRLSEGVRSALGQILHRRSQVGVQQAGARRGGRLQPRTMAAEALRCRAGGTGRTGY